MERYDYNYTRIVNVYSSKKEAELSILFYYGSGYSTAKLYIEDWDVL